MRSAFLFGALCSAPIAAAVPLSFTQQGRVVGASGLPLEGSHSVAFALYAAPSGGTALWTTTQTVVFADGHYSATLSSVDAFACWAVDGRELGLELGLELERNSDLEIEAFPSRRRRAIWRENM